MATYPEPLPPAPPRSRRRRGGPSVHPRQARVEPLHARADPTNTMAKKKDAKAAHPADSPRLSQHPKAQQQISTAKAWGGLVLFLLVGFASMQQGLPAATVCFRALAAGTVGYVAAYAVAVVVWRQIALNEVNDLRRKLSDDADETADVAA